MKKYLIIVISIVLFFACEDKQEKDCAGVEGGTAILDNCEQCVGGDTGDIACTEDCNGDFGGTAVLDCSGDCDGNLEEDCADVCGGTAQIDCAGVCDGNAEILTYWYDTDNDGLGSDESQQFCNASVEEGWVLNGDDADDNCTSNVHDCAGVCDGDSPDTDNDGICDWNDGDSYETVILGSQEWMAENLKATHYRNGDEIPTGYSNSEWADIAETETGAYAVYDDDPSNAETYGNLYNWYAVDDSRGVCPEGWHIPTDEGIKVLEMYLGMSQSEADNSGWRGTNEGSKLAGRSDLWTAFSGEQNTNIESDSEFGTSGFNLTPGGTRFYNGQYGDMGYASYFWSSTGDISGTAWSRNLSYLNSEIYRGSSYNLNGFSVRCIKD